MTSHLLPRLLLSWGAITFVNACCAQERELSQDGASTEKPYLLFLANPTAYSFQCGGDLGGVLDAALGDDGEMTITYYYPESGLRLIGTMRGSFEQRGGAFEGFYNTSDGKYTGQIDFVFDGFGQARGGWNHGTGRVRMLLLEK